MSEEHLIHLTIKFDIPTQLFGDVAKSKPNALSTLLARACWAAQSTTRQSIEDILRREYAPEPVRQDAVARVEELAAEVERLRAGIEAYLNGDYPSPRDHRPGKCEHDVYYWEPCEQCVDQHFTKLLAAAPTKPR